MKYAAGQYANLLERALSAAMTPPAEAGFPAANLWDGRVSRPARHDSNAANPSITADLAAFDGSLGSWAGGAPAGWTKATMGTGTFLETTTEGEYVTTPAAKGNPGDGSALLYRDFTARAGERRKVSASLRIAGSGVARVSIQNLATKKYLSSDGSWGAALAYVLLDDTHTVHTTQAVTYQVESLTLCQWPTVTLRLTLNAGGAGDSMYDDVYDWPRWNAAVVMGHNLDVGLAVELRSSSDGFVSSNVLEKAGAILQPGFFLEAPAVVANRYARVAFTGSNVATPWYGELAVCYLETSIRGPKWAYDVKYQESQIRNEGRLGESFRYNLAPIGRRVAKLSPVMDSAPGENEVRQEIVWRCRGGAYPLAIVPKNDEAIVLFGRLEDNWSATRLFPDWWEGDLVVSEETPAAALA